MKLRFQLLTFVFLVIGARETMSQSYLNSGWGCVVIAVHGKEIGSDLWKPYVVPGLVIAPPNKLLERPKDLLKQIDTKTTVRKTFEILGTGMLYIKQNYVEWYFLDGTSYRIRLGKNIDKKPLWTKRMGYIRQCDWDK